MTIVLHVKLDGRIMEIKQNITGNKLHWKNRDSYFFPCSDSSVFCTVNLKILTVKWSFSRNKITNHLSPNPQYVKAKN